MQCVVLVGLALQEFSDLQKIKYRFNGSDLEGEKVQIMNEYNDFHFF